MKGSPRGAPLGVQWIRQQQQQADHYIKHCVKTAMQAGQTSATVARLVLDQDIFNHKNEGGVFCSSWKVRQVISKELSANWRRDYWLDARYAPLIQAIEQEGLGWCICNAVKGINEVLGDWVVDPIHALLVYWHPSTASEGQPNLLHKYYLGLVMQTPVDEACLARYHALIRRAMDAGQQSCVLTCLGYKQSYWPDGGGGGRVCAETRHYLTGAHIVLPKISPQWRLDDKFEPLLEWLVDKHKLAWGLRFCPVDENKLVIDAQSQLQPWALLVASW